MPTVERDQALGLDKPAVARDSVERHWFALEVNARHEKAVARILNQKGYETFLPLYANRHQYAKRWREFELPLFPGYVFCRFDARMRLPILTTPGVIHVVGAGRTPVAVESTEIEALQTALKAKARMLPWPFWQTGQRGRVTGGPLSGVEGIVVSVKEPVRLVLSISLLQRSVLVEIDAASVSLA